MKVIGLTGGTGSGKGAVSQCLKKAGAYIIDADNIAHDIIKKGRPAYEALVSFFGQEILGEDKEIFRRKLGEIVFQDKEKLKFLNQCTHHFIVEEIKIEIIAAKETNKTKMIVIDAPLLLEVGLDAVCDEVWVVYATEEIRMQRIMERDGIDQETARGRILSQKPWAEYERAAQVIIDNNQDKKALAKEVEKLFENRI